MRGSPGAVVQANPRGEVGFPSNGFISAMPRKCLVIICQAIVGPVSAADIEREKSCGILISSSSARFRPQQG